MQVCKINTVTVYSKKKKNITLAAIDVRATSVYFQSKTYFSLLQQANRPYVWLSVKQGSPSENIKE